MYACACSSVWKVGWVRQSSRSLPHKTTLQLRKIAAPYVAGVDGRTLLRHMWM
jgi:hypothetical protein